ncbi:MAG: bifunctional phosphoglucose/phosphomannose isomerase [Acidimicrobiales bacterium]
MSTGLGAAGLGALDSAGMLEATAALPEQVARAAERASGLAGLPDHTAVENVVVLGMGGSGIAGDLLLAVAGPYLPVPVTVVKSYTPPAFIGPGTLVFAISFSGNTEETVEAAGEALAAQARLVVVTGGGQLSDLAGRAEVPVVPVPADVPQPRAAIGSMAVPLLIMLEDIGLFPGATGWVELAVAQLRTRREQLLGPASPAAELAARIGSTIPLIHSSRALGAAAAQRWKTQVNENAKAPAFWAVYPELCHNEVCGWGDHAGQVARMITVVNLRHDAEHPQVARRFELVDEVAARSVAGVCEVRAEGEGELAQLLDLIMVGDFMSLHLAAGAGVDPGPIPVLTEIKNRLREG